MMDVFIWGLPAVFETGVWAGFEVVIGALQVHNLCSTCDCACIEVENKKSCIQDFRPAIFTEL